MHEPAIVRFAPSPTGPPHLGNLRTALFDWLLARATGGRFIVRIDDTDRTRYDPQAEAQMLGALRWLGLNWDEGPEVGGPHAPYRQSERLTLYQQAAERLIESGHAYRCTCPPERVEAVQARLKAQGRPQVYDNHCRDLSIGPTDEPYVVRLKTPLRGSLTFHDLIRGNISFEYKRLAGDIILLKSDGYPTYHLAMVVDDHDMGITHILRGEEWIPSTPLHLLLFEALGYEPPAMVHLSLVTDREGRKIKKREPSFEVSAYREGGFLPEAVINYLALLGWHPGTTEEIFTPAELIERFSLDRLSKSPAAFDEDRLRWFNRQHLARLSLEELATRVLPLVRAAYPQAASRDDEWLIRLISLARDEMATLLDVVPATRFAFEAGNPTPEALEALTGEQGRPVLSAFLEALDSITAPLDTATADAFLRGLRGQFKQSHGWGGRAVMFPVRAALTGSVTGPHLADVLALLGKEEACRRVKAALSLL
jgi:glutamyl-tRNA synthetase